MLSGRRLAALVTVLAVWLPQGDPAVAEPTARELLDKVREVNETTRKWTDRTQQMAVTIVDRRGTERRRQMRIYYKKYPEDRNKTLLFFEEPADVKGVGFLQWADPHGKDTQWLYLPELKRPPRQISGGAKRESFAGTDFSYDDLSILGQLVDWSEADARTRLLRTETADGSAAHVIEFTPTGKDVGYSRIVAWLRAGDLLMTRYDLYTDGSEPDKVLVLDDIRNVGPVPTAFRMEMRNARSGSRTEVRMTETRYDTGLGDDQFTQRTLERGP
ncbi:outer membrane lipoprotein-sorting protein [Candidatus Binatia bacterium]|nr:outer membrane lipoprotein-sorting protein [Candidatus Binatia bacterium]